MKEIIEQARKLVAEDKLETAFKLLEEQSNLTDRNTFTLIQAAFNAIQKKKISGVLYTEQELVEIARIRENLLNYLDILSAINGNSKMSDTNFQSLVKDLYKILDEEYKYTKQNNNQKQSNKMEILTVGFLFILQQVVGGILTKGGETIFEHFVPQEETQKAIDTLKDEPKNLDSVATRLAEQEDFGQSNQNLLALSPADTLTVKEELVKILNCSKSINGYTTKLTRAATAQDIEFYDNKISQLQSSRKEYEEKINVVLAPYGIKLQ